MNYTIEKIRVIVRGEFLQVHDPGIIIENLLLDSRKAFSVANSLFFALKTNRRNAHYFIPDLYNKGVRAFVVSEKINAPEFPEATFIHVDDTMAALQELAAHHRRQFNIPVIGITGSNGKTIVKEWLNQLLEDDFTIVRSPKSYNSQTGVPLSVWQMNEQHGLAIFEAGISRPGEMEKLETIIQPTIAVLTNIGDAHNEGFESPRQKALEKVLLLRNASVVVVAIDKTRPAFLSTFAHERLLGNNARLYTWGEEPTALLYISRINVNAGYTEITGRYSGTTMSVTIPFSDEASIDNAITCWCVMLALGYEPSVITERIRRLQPVNMRLELKKGINNCSVINDSYSADLGSLHIALNFLQQQSTGEKSTVILSDFLQSGIPDQQLYGSIASLLRQHKVSRVIGIGENISARLPGFLQDVNIAQHYFPTTGSFIRHFLFSQFRDEAILIKGARVFEFEQIIPMLEQKMHQTLLEVNLNAIVHNLRQYQSQLKPGTKLMAMVKAFAYGSGGAEIASVLQYHKVDWLGVAYADEGVELRRTGITVPIMVMNPEERSFNTMVAHDLEPEIYSFDLFDRFEEFLDREAIRNYPVHIEIETGMNRLGFLPAHVKELGRRLVNSPFRLQSVFSHLVASEEAGQDAFTRKQFSLFNDTADQLAGMVNYPFLRHLSNSAAITRHPEMQLDMVRLGIGLYGVDTASSKKLDLQPVATLRSTIAQIRNISSGESVSYNRKGMVKRDSIIATVRIGYADGYPRRLGNGKGKMLVRGAFAPVIGTVCMDMTMIDITDIAGVKEGDEVIVFGKDLTVEKLASWAGTIPYEIMTGVSQRVKRVYFEE